MKNLGAALLAATMLLTGCSGASGDNDDPTVVTSFYPLQYVAERIAEDNVTVTNLTQPGMEPHDLELGVQSTAEIVDADVMLYAKGFQPAVDSAVEQNGPEHVVDAAAVARVDDPHFWLSTTALVEVGEAFRDEMTQAHPTQAAEFAKNFESLRDDLDAVDRDYAAGLADCKIHTTVVSHDAFGALEKYGLEFVAINGLSPDAEPSPSHVRQLHDLAEAEGVTTVFSEELASPKMADTLAEDLRLRTAVLDPIEGLSDDTSDDTSDEDYLSLMRSNLDALKTANQCR